MKQNVMIRPEMKTRVVLLEFWTDSSWISKVFSSVANCTVVGKLGDQEPAALCRSPDWLGGPLILLIFWIL